MLSVSASPEAELGSGSGMMPEPRGTDDMLPLPLLSPSSSFLMLPLDGKRDFRLLKELE